MIDLHQQLVQVKKLVQIGTKDHSLIQKMLLTLQKIQIQQINIKQFTKHLYQIYDLSNHNNLIKWAQIIEPQPLSFSLKLLALKMLVKLVSYYIDHPHIQKPNNILSDALQMMILLSRVLMDFGYISQIKQYYHLTIIFRDSYSMQFPKQIDQFHYLNILQIQQLGLDSKTFCLRQYKKAYQSLLSSSQKQKSQQLQLANDLVFEAVLKLLKNGDLDSANSLKRYLNEQNLSFIDDLTNNREIKQSDNNIKISPFYQLYLQLKKEGMQNIGEQQLRSFIFKDNNYQNPALFDVVALTLQPLPLQIWFQYQLQKKTKSQNIQLGYRCYMYLIDTCLQLLNNNKQQNSLIQTYKIQTSKLEKLINISKLVLVLMLSQKKQNLQLSNNIIKRISKVLITAVINLYPELSIVKQLAQRLQLVCNKHSLPQIGRAVISIYFYYQLVMGVADQNAYNNFYKNNLLDKSSSLFKTLKIAWELRSGKYDEKNNEIDTLYKDPFLCVLLAKEDKKIVVLKIVPQQFVKLNQKWQVYLLLLSEQYQNNNCILQILKHMQQVLIRFDFSLIKVATKLMMKKILYQISFLLNKSNDNETQIKLKGSLVGIYLSLIESDDRIINFNHGILLNRYSKLSKLINFSIDTISKNKSEQIQNMLVYFSKLFVTNQLQIFKLNNNKQDTTGLAICINQIFQIIKKIEKNQNVIVYFKFVRFQLLCYLNSFNQVEIITQKNYQLLKLYCSSEAATKQIKLKILRYLIKQNLTGNQKILSLNQLNQAILFAENSKQKLLYARFIISNYGQDGKQYLNIQSQLHPQLYKFLLQELNQNDI